VAHSNLCSRLSPRSQREESIQKLIKEEIMKAKYLRHLVVLSTLTLPLAVSAQDNKHSVDITDAVQIGSTQLTPGTYKLEWQGTGPVIQVSFQYRGKSVVTVPATLKTNDDQVTQNEIVTEAATAGGSTRVLKEIDFGHQKQALVFDQNPGGM
jgi:hypothetical protein